MVSKLGVVNNKKIILEPCAGEGIFVKELIKTGVSPERIVAFDIDLGFVETYRQLGINFCISDFLLSDVKQQSLVSKFDCVIGNPPYLSRHSAYIRENKEKMETEKDYGVFIFSCPYAEETHHIQTALLRCFGDE